MNQRGSAILFALPLTIALGVMAGSFAIWHTSHAQLQMRTKATERSNAVSISLKMLFASRDACKQNLTPGAFGTHLSDLTKSTSIRFVLPDSSGMPKGTLLAAGEKYEGLSVIKLEFSQPRSFFAGESSYIVDLMVSYLNPITKSNQRFTIPFYFTTDASGNLTDCLLTSYVPVAAPLPVGQYPATTDDLICAQMRGGPDFIYLPLNQTCTPKGYTAAQN